MLTSGDIARLTEVFATRSYLREYVNPKFEKLERTINDRFDKLLKELIHIRQELLINRQEHDDVNGRLDDIKSLPTVAHQLALKKHST